MYPVCTHARPNIAVERGVRRSVHGKRRHGVRGTDCQKIMSRGFASLLGGAPPSIVRLERRCGGPGVKEFLGAASFIKGSLA
jgi:hypothetical protein